MKNLFVLFAIIANTVFAFSQEVDGFTYWKDVTFNIDYEDRDELIRLGPTDEEPVSKDGDFWKKPADEKMIVSVFSTTPAELGFNKSSYSYYKFIDKVLNMGYTIPPKWLILQLYLNGENVESGTTMHFSTTAVTRGNGSYLYTIGKNDKGSTPTKKEYDLFLKERSKIGHRDLWIFVKKE